MADLFLDHDPHDGQEYDTQCARCGSSITWETCSQCGGDGYYGHDCGEDTCCCLYPEYDVPCDHCDGTGGWHACLSSSAWCRANPLPGREEVDGSVPEYFALPPRDAQTA